MGSPKVVVACDYLMKTKLSISNYSPLSTENDRCVHLPGYGGMSTPSFPISHQGGIVAPILQVIPNSSYLYRIEGAASIAEGLFEVARL